MNNANLCKELSGKVFALLTNYIDSPEAASNVTTRIMSVFRDAGWQDPNKRGGFADITYYKHGKTTIVSTIPYLMTGQEWYDRFMELCDQIPYNHGISEVNLINGVHEAARKAADIE